MLLFLLSFFFPMVPPINSLSRSFKDQTFTKRKRTDKERIRETLKPRLKREEYQEQHTLSLTLSRCTHKQRKRETNDRNKNERTKSAPRDTIEGFSPTHNKFSFLYIERLCLFEYKAKTENKRRETKDRKSLDPLPSVSLFRTPSKALSRSS